MSGGQKIIDGLKEALAHAKGEETGARETRYVVGEYPAITIGLPAFVRESNAIEGIHRNPTKAELRASEQFLRLPKVTLDALNELQSVFAAGKPLRDRVGMNVYVGDYTAPIGGRTIVADLMILLGKANTGKRDPWKMHIAFERLHPYLDGNGRTGRMLWAWQMRNQGQDPFALSFLHRFYYETLRNS